MKQYLLLFLLILPLAHAATLQGAIYNEEFDLQANVLVEIDTTPEQKFLSKQGTYNFDIPPGSYTLTATYEDTIIKESITIIKDGTFTLDLFLLPTLGEEGELWDQSNEDFFTEEEETDNTLRNLFLGFFFILAIIRIVYYRKKYGSLKLFRKRVKSESKKSINEHKIDLKSEPDLINKTIEIIKKHDGRITQKELRKELLYLSEAKVSLLVTELEHKGQIEKVKKGRGNVILLK